MAHGPLEFLFTIDEESGLTGAAQFPGGLLQAKYFLNLDGEEEGTLCIGCAGGLNTVARRKVARRAAAPSGEAWRIKVSGLQGGHSGIDINKGRGNAVRILGRVLQTLMGGMPLAIAAINGGSKRNAIPREASATVVIEGARRQDLTRWWARWKPRCGWTSARSMPACALRWKARRAPSRSGLTPTPSKWWDCWPASITAFWR